MKIEITRDQYLEVEKIALGVFHPLHGFMSEADFYSCVDNYRLASGEVFTVPIIFDVGREVFQNMQQSSSIQLFFEGEHVANLFPSSWYRVEKENVVKKIFATDSLDHPGVKNFLHTKEYFVGGKVEMLRRPQFEFAKYELTPQETKSYFKSMNWQTVVGFQTRNVPHRAHEYLQKVALETVDGILIQPLVGKKKSGDYKPEAVVAGYEALVQNYYPDSRVKLAVLSTVMRYAGPREAVFHALIRSNYGCTHFIIGRDHAGVGGFYGKYAAHALAEKFENELRIKIMKLSGPYYCQACQSIVTEKTCPHYVKAPDQCIEISGTLMRKLLKAGDHVDQRFMRPEVVQALQNIDVFI